MSEARAPTGAAAPEITDERSAVPAFEALFGDAGKDAGAQTDSEPDEGDEAGPDESSAAGEEDEGHSEPPARPAAIEPPNSWSAEDKAVFARLPPEAQAIVSRRESQRDAETSRRFAEIADERKGWDAERAAIATQRQTYLQSLQQLTAIALPESKEFESVDWARLAAENPAEYVRLAGRREALIGRIGALQAEMKRVGDEHAATQQQQITAFLGQQHRLLREKVPEFADAAAGPKLAGELSRWLEAQGFDPAEVANAADHRMIVVALKAMRAEQATAARATAAGKADHVPPRTLPAGTAATGGGKERRFADGVKQLGRTNSARDAARLLEDLF